MAAKFRSHHTSNAPPQLQGPAQVTDMNGDFRQHRFHTAFANYRQCRIANQSVIVPDHVNSAADWGSPRRRDSACSSRIKRPHRQPRCFRRVSDLAVRWCQRNDVGFDTDPTFHDLGVSALRDRNTSIRLSCQDRDLPTPPKQNPRHGTDRFVK